MILPIIDSQVARITSIRHLHTVEYSLFLLQHNSYLDAAKIPFNQGAVAHTCYPSYVGDMIGGSQSNASWREKALRHD
jgi:hypothetical protein